MKRRYIAADRNPDKQYRNIRFSGWTKSCGDIIEEAYNYKDHSNRFAKAELIRYVRFGISEAEDAAAKLQAYQNILETFNRSAKTDADVDTLIEQLSSFKFKQH